jgi:predicted TIM-barrel fold metal-dependent hydrolase
MLPSLILSSDSHVFEPPDLWTSRIDRAFRERAPRMQRLDGADQIIVEKDQILSGIGLISNAGARFAAPETISGSGRFEDVPRGGYDPEQHLADMRLDGVAGEVLYPSQGLFYFRVSDTSLMSAIFRAYNDWLAEFCQADPARLKGIAMINVDDVDDACGELERCYKLGLVGAFIPVSPLSDKPYRHPIYERFWWTAADLRIPLLLHIGTPRGGVPGCEFTMNLGELTGAGRSTTDYWVRYSLGAMIFAGVFDRYPKLLVGSVEHEAAWIPHWLKQMDFTYRERPVFTKGWRSKEGLLPSDYWRRNMFVEFMEDDLGVQLRDLIGVDTMLWGSDFPHAESTWPKSRDFLDRMFGGVPESDLRKITSENAARLFGFDLS